MPNYLYSLVYLIPKRTDGPRTVPKGKGIIARLTLGIVTAVAVWVLSCGTPLGPGPASWQARATVDAYFDQDLFKVAVDGDAVFFPYRPSEESRTGGIKKYDNGVITDAYVPALNGAKYASIVSVAISPQSGWALGYRGYETGGNNLRYVPFLVKYGNGVWPAGNELEFERISEDFPMAVVPVGPDSCYLLGEGRSAVTPKKLYTYQDGTLTEIPLIEVNTLVYDAAAGVTYSLACKGNRIDVMLSVDGGAHWTYEGLWAEAPVNGYSAGYVAAAVAPGGALYVFSRTDNPGGTVVYRRTGIPGSGIYEMCGYYPTGPYAGFASGMAVANDGRVLVVGDETSIYYDGAEWREELLPDKNDFWCVAAGASGFYAIGRNGTGSSDTQLFYHP